MTNDEILILRGDEIQFLLDGQEHAIMDRVQKAYELHSRGMDVLPHSSFLRFPHDARNRIIALPAYLGGEFGVAGIKWISSFPGNLSGGLRRASGVVILNSMQTGRPEALLEASVINAKRTAASAALAAKYLAKPADEAVVIGCGIIGFEITRFLKVVFPRLSQLIIYDLDAERAARFQRQCVEYLDFEHVRIAADLDSALHAASLVSLATTAATPYVHDLSMLSPNATVLHVSLRDLAPEIILNAENIVDDIDHVCRAQTSLDLAQQITGNRNFIRGTLADLFLQNITPDESGKVRIFSPFGLGILDLAVGSLVKQLGIAQQVGTLLGSFAPGSMDLPLASCARSSQS